MYLFTCFTPFSQKYILIIRFCVVSRPFGSMKIAEDLFARQYKEK